MMVDDEMEDAAADNAGGNESGSSATPISMPKFNKRAKPQLRKRRKADSDDEKADPKDDAEVKAIQAVPAVKEKKEGGGSKKTLKKGASASLSFEVEAEDEADEDAFAAKKKKERAKAEKVAFQMEKDREKAAAQSSYYSSGNSYGAEDLAALSKNTRTLGGSGIKIPAAPPPVVKIESEAKKKRKDQADAPVALKGLSWTKRESSPEEAADNDVDMADAPRVRGLSAKNEENHDIAAEMKMALGGDGGASIPSEEHIARLKARREEARRLGTSGTQGKLAKEFIPLEGSLDEQKEATSRLVREDIDDDEDAMVADDIGREKGRLGFGMGESRQARRRAEMAAAEGMVMGEDGDGGDDDEEARAWEQQQIRIAPSMSAVLPLASGISRSASAVSRRGGGCLGQGNGHGKGAGLGAERAERRAAEEEERGRGEGGRGGVLPGAARMGAASAASAAAGLTIKQVQATLKGHLDRMRGLHAEEVSRLNDATKRLEISRSSVSKMEDDMVAANERYTFFQETKLYLQDLLECMDVKAPLVEELEEDIFEATRRRRKARRKRRSRAISDIVQDAREEVAKATGKALPAEEQELDEFGRDPSLQRGRRMKETEERRARSVQRRRELRGGAGGGGAAQTISEEMWTSDESEGEVEAWTQTKRKAVDQAKDVMEDVGEEFKTLPAVQARLAGWRRRYAKSYKEAYVDMSLPRLLAPFVRLETLGWDPLEDGQTVEGMEWVKVLFEAEDDNDDSDLIPNLVEQVLCPQIKVTLSTSWDPASSGSTGRAVGLLNDVLIYILDAAPDAAKALCNEVVTALSMELDTHTAALGLLSKGDSAGRAAFRAGRLSFLQCCKIVRNAAAFRDIVSPLALQTLTIEAATREMLLPFLQAVRTQAPGDAIALTKLLYDSFPDEWMGLPALQSFLSFRAALIGER